MTALEDISRERLKRDRQWKRAQDRLASLIAQARSDKETWPAIAEAMGMTRQGLRLFMQRNGSE